MKKLLLFIFLFSTAGVYAQQVPKMDDKNTAAIVKACYLYNFAKLVDWPDDYKKGNFIISVMGSSDLHQELVKGYNSKQIGSQQIEIRKISKTLNISKCHVLFVGSDCCDILPEIVEALKDKPTLIVGDCPGALDMGAILNFVFYEGQWKYTLNTSNADEKNLFIGSTLKSLALKVETK